MLVANQTTSEEKGDASTKAMLLLLNSKNNSAKKDLHLSYTQGNKSAYPVSTESMARYLSTQYNTKSINHPRNRKGEQNGKKGDKSKSEDKDNSNTGTVGAHIGIVTTLQDSIAPSNVSSIGTHVSEVAKPEFWPARTVEELLVAHPINDAIWSCTNPGDVSIDSVNSTEILAGSHITAESTYTFCRFNLYKLIHNDDLSWYDGSDFLDYYGKWDESPNTDSDDVVTNDSVNESIKPIFWIGEH